MSAKVRDYKVHFMVFQEAFNFSVAVIMYALVTLTSDMMFLIVDN